MFLHSMFLLVYMFLLSLSNFGCQARKVLLLNAISLDDEEENHRAILQMKAILDEVHDDLLLWSTLTTKIAFVRKFSYDKISNDVKYHLESELGVEIRFFSTTPFVYKGYARKNKVIEHVSSVLESLGATFLSTDESMVALTFSGTINKQ